MKETVSADSGVESVVVTFKVASWYVEQVGTDEIVERVGRVLFEAIADPSVMSVESVELVADKLTAGELRKAARTLRAFARRCEMAGQIRMHNERLDALAERLGGMA